MSIKYLLTGKRGPQPPPQQAPWLRGTVNAVPCPHCGHKNNFTELESQQLLDTGHEVACDKCHRMMEVCQIALVKVIGVRAADGVESQSPHNQPARQAFTLSPEQARRLLR